MNREQVFHQSVGVGYYPSLVWQCECSSTECYSVRLSPYLDGDESPEYIIRDWERERDWLCGVDYPVIACLSPSCKHHIAQHQGREREFPTAALAKKVKAGLFTKPLEAEGIDFSGN